MKPKLKGDLQKLYAAKATIRRNEAIGQFVEYIIRCDYSMERSADGTTHLVKRPSYRVAICGVNKHGAPFASDIDPESETAYFWQCANYNAVKSVLNSPVSAYDYLDVKNGIKASN